MNNEEVNNELLITHLEVKFLGEKLLNSPKYKEINDFYMNILKAVPRGYNFKECKDLNTKLLEVVKMVNEAEKAMVTITMTIGEFEQLKSAIETLEYDMASQYNALSGGDISWDCYDQDNWDNSHTFCMKIANLLKIEIESNIEVEELAHDESN